MNRVLHDKDIREPLENPHMTWKRKLSIQKSKAFVVGKIVERIPTKIPEQRLKEQISELLFERDYNTIEEMRRITV
jgi:hypothetical protein